MNMIPIIMPINTRHTVDCITSSGKTYCEKSNISNETFGMIIIGTVIWTAILLYFLYKHLDDDDYSGWIPASYVFISFILLGLSFIFS